MAQAVDRSRPFARVAGAASVVRAHEATWAVSTGLLSLAAAAVTLRLWRADFGVPFDYTGDANYTTATLKGVIEHGWLGSNPSLGAPNGQDGWDFPAWNGDMLNVAVLKMMGALFGSAQAAINVYYVLSFPLVALVAYLVLRRLDCSRPAAMVAAVLFSVLPYHFLRGEDHLFLAAAYSVPLGAYLALSTLWGDPMFERRPGARLAGFATRPTVVTVLLCVVIATAGLYYAAFTIVLVAAAGLLAAFVRGRRALLGPVIACALIAGTLGLAFSPTVVYRLQNGSNPALERHAFETEAFSLRLAQLFLPAPDHRIEALANVKKRYEDKVGVTEASFAALGVVGSIGFIWLLALAFVSLVGAGDRAGPPRVRHAAALALVALLFATTGGLAAAVSFLVTPQLHAWNRMSMFIAFFSLLAVGIGLDILGRRAARLVPAVAALALVVGVVDQTSPAYAPAYASVERDWKSDGALVEEIDRRLPENAAVFELPYMPFPAAGSIERMIDYDPLRPYLHADDLRWSYGAIKGRPEDVGDDVAALPPDRLAPRLRDLGFSGIWVDRDGYADDGATVESGLRAVAGAPLASPDGRLLFFDLRGAR